ncbi:MAG TPA: PAS domain S-box protein [Steroidobacteraceae bacterium]
MISQSLNRKPGGEIAPAFAVQAAAVLDPIFSGLARLAATVCQAPYACIVLTGYGESWCTPQTPLPADDAPRPDPFIKFASHAEELFEIADVCQDERFSESRCLIAARAVRFYAGCPLRIAGAVIGTLAVYDTVARRLTDDQRAALRLLSTQGAAHADALARLSELSLLAGTEPRSSSMHLDATLARALIESAPVAVYHTETTSSMTYCNREYRRIFGLTADQSPNDWALAVHPDDRARIEDVWVDFCRNPRPVRFEYRTAPGEGTVRYFSEQVVAADGVTGFVGTITDFTDLVTARDNLRKAETLFRDTFEQAPIGVAFARRGGKFLRCNRTFCDMLGFDPHELADKTIGDVTHPDDVAHTTAELERLWNGETDTVDLEKRYSRKDGSVLWVRMTTALVRENSATPEYSVEFLRDITARKDSALELERVNKQLMSASRQAGMAEVATNVLHNVGNILNSVNISASLVAERVKQSKAPGVSRLAALLREKGPLLGDFVANDESGKRIPEYLATLGEQLLTDQKIALQELASLRDNLEHIKDTVAMQQSYAKLCGVTETVKVVDLVEDSLRLNAGAFARHGVTLRREFSDVPPITVDKHKVLQILVNLVRNAKYACDESGKTEKLITLRIESAAIGVRIAVIDNGVGILAENRDRLFTHGFTTRQSGHGFGLHSGALAAQELGGTLHAESDGPGRGAAFILELPCVPLEHSRG